MKKLFLISFAICHLTSAILLTAQPTTWNSRGVGGGGALFSPSINPTNTSEYFIACDMSELFHTTDFGLTYSQVHFAQFTGGHNSRVAFTSTPNLLYSISYISDIGTPVTSTDGGVTWSLVTGNPDPSQDVYTIHVDYSTPSRIVISTYGKIYFSGNGGTSFTQIHTAANAGSGNVVGGVFFDGQNIYIGTNDGVLVSTNGGGSFSTATITGLPASERIWSFCGGKSGGTTRFFCLTGDVNDIYVGLQGSDYFGFYKGVYSCDYGSTQWVAKNTGITANDFPMFVDMAENDINTAYLAGSNSVSEPAIMKTANAGGNWANTFITNNNQNIITGWQGYQGDDGWSWGECPFGFDVCATNKDIVVFGDFGFAHKTNNGGTSWQQAYTDVAYEHPANAPTPKYQEYKSCGQEQTTCWQVHWINANEMWASFSDIGGVRSIDAGNKWSFNYTGNNVNSTYRVAQGTNGTLYAGTSNIHDMYQSTRLQDAILDANDANGRISYSTDNGFTWQQLHFFNHPVFWIALDPNNSNRAYASVIHYNGGAGVGGVYRCDDLNNLASSTWTLLPNPPNTEKHPACLVVLNDGKLVATYSGRRNSSGTFTASSGCFIYDTVANSWTDVTDPGMKYWTKDFVIDPNDAQQNTWYVGVFSGWGGPPNGLGGLYKTTNRGASWTKLTGSTLDRVTSCTFNPSNANEIYLTTETQGLWWCGTINAPTPAFSNLASYPFRQPERVFFNPNNSNEIWITSFGNGMKMGLMNPNNIVEFSEEEFSVYPNPASSSIFVIASSDLIGTKQSLEVYNSLGEKIGSWKLSAGKNEINVSNMPSGIYFAKIGNVVKKIVVSK